MAVLPRLSALLLLLVLVACGGPRPQIGTVPAPGPTTCVPFARELSGVALFGDARTWWAQSAGRYDRSQRPAIGSVLVFKPTRAMSSGHVAVVTQVVRAREIRVAHANWASGREKGVVLRDQQIIDVSPRNDWTQVQVWFAPGAHLGRTVWNTWGFITAPDRPGEREIARAIPVAARVAATTRPGQQPSARNTSR